MKGGKKKMTAWDKHVKETIKNNKELMKEEGLGAILKLASKSYKKQNQATNKNDITKKVKKSKQRKQKGGTSEKEIDTTCDTTEKSAETPKSEPAGDDVVGKTDPDAEAGSETTGGRKKRRSRKSSKTRKSRKARKSRKSRKRNKSKRS